MSNDLIKHWIVFFVLSVFTTSCANAQIINLSTDEAVRRELAKNTEFKFKFDRLCIERLRESAKNIVVGNHANDRDCEIDGVFVSSRYFDARDVNLSKTALVALGWKKANQQKREQLAKLWVTKGLLVFFTVLYTKDKDFNDGEFQSPQVVSKENGETIVTLWTSSMRKKKEFHRHEFRFAKDGNLSQ